MITGAGPAFCAGGNVKGMGDNRAPLSIEEAEERLKERQRTLTGVLMAMRKPTIAVLPGPAIGAGLSLALACDLRIMAQSAFVGTGYVRVGLSGDYGIAWMLTSLLGSARARELMFTGARVDAATCERLGLANRVVADDRLQEEAFAFAKELADGPAVALGLIKDNLNWATGHDFLSALDHEAENMIQAGRTADHKEAVRAFIEKRKPQVGMISADCFESVPLLWVERGARRRWRLLRFCRTFGRGGMGAGIGFDGLDPVAFGVVTPAAAAEKARHAGAANTGILKQIVGVMVRHGFLAASVGQEIQHAADLNQPVRHRGAVAGQHGRQHGQAGKPDYRLHRMVVGDMTHLMGQHAGQFVGAFGIVQQAAQHHDLPARQGEGVDRRRFQHQDRDVG